MDGFSAQPLGPPGRGLRLIGELDVASAGELTAALSSIDGDGDLTLDLSELTFIDSAGLHVIVQHAASLGGSKLVLVDPTEMTRRIFEIVGLDQHTSIVIQRGGSGQ